MTTRHALAFLSLLCTAPLASADLITGRVLDSNGAPVAGVNIDAIAVSTGDDVTLFNDGTSGSGTFSTTIPAGVYDLYFFPPAPPATSHVALKLPNVVVVGTKALGDLALQAGAIVSGHVQTQGGFPVAQVTLEVLDEATGQLVPLAVRKTNAFGDFDVSVPKNAIEVRLDATSVATPVLASRAFALSPTASVDLGTITLLPGMTVSGHVQRASNGAAVSGVDLDFSDATSGVKLYTPDDNTNSLGDFAVVVPAGTYDVELCAPAATLLVGQLRAGVVVTGNLTLGRTALAAGVVLSGTIKDYLNAPVQNADVDVRLSASGAAVVLCSDNSNASGAYSVVVPAGTLDVTFSPPGAGCASGLALDRHPGVVVAGNTVLNGTLPAIPTATASTYAGDGINADTVAAVSAVLGSTWTAPLTLGHPHGASGFVVLKIRTGVFNGPNLPSPSGGRVTEPLITGPLLATFSGTHGGSSGGVPAQPIPADVALAGLAWAAQYTVAGGGFVDLSRAVSGVVGCL